VHRRAHVLALGLLDNLDVSCISLVGVPDLLLLTQDLEMSGGGRPTFENGDTFIGRGIEGSTISRIELVRNPFIEALVVKIYPFFNPALLRVGPPYHLTLDSPA
jgi:hypothetical protein